MNGTEQRRQATVAQKLDQTAENLAVLFDALDARVFDLATKAQETRREVNTLKVDFADFRHGTNDSFKDVTETCATRWQRTGFSQQELFTRVYTLENALLKRSFWGRLRWLCLGR